MLLGLGILVITRCGLGGALLRVGGATGEVGAVYRGWEARLREVGGVNVGGFWEGRPALNGIEPCSTASNGTARAWGFSVCAGRGGGAGYLDTVVLIRAEVDLMTRDISALNR